jgi:2-polyprenyl-3-methyl-5-hydroxy-6-metoxy-1,4-benzoquinol methylase
MVSKPDAGNKRTMQNADPDKAGEAYWSAFWQNNPLPAPVSLDQKSAGNYTFRKLDSIFKEVFHKNGIKGGELLEVGCGNSVFLSYFAKEFGFRIAGLDYSVLGCEQTKKILKRDGLEGDIIHGDIFQPPTALINRFDVVCSFGVVEHFDDTSEVLKRISSLLKPGGLLITTIPNLTGVTGWMQKTMNRPVYDIHKVMNLEDLEKANRSAGLTPVHGQYFIPVSFGVTLLPRGDQPVPRLKLKKWILKSFQVVGNTISKIDDIGLSFPSTPLLSAGIVVAALKPSDRITE